MNRTEFKALAILMDDEIREAVHYDLAPCTDEDFLAEYQRRHTAKYGQPLTTNATTPIRAARLKAGMTQAELAARVGCTQKDISRWETGKRKPTVGSLCMIAWALGYLIDDLTND